MSTTDPRPVEARVGVGDTGDGATGGQDLRTLARGGGLNAVGGIAHGVVGLLVVVAITRGLPSAADAGAFLEGIALFMVAVRMVQLGAGSGLIRMVSRSRVLGTTGEVRVFLLVAVVPVLVVGLGVAVTATLMADEIGRLLGHGREEELASYVRVLAPFLPVTAVFLVLSSGSRGFGTMLPAVATDQIGRGVLQLALVALTVALGLGPWAIGLAWSVPSVAALVTITWWTVGLVRRVGASVPAPPTRPVARIAEEFWRFSLPRALSGLFAVSVLWLDTILLGAFASTREAGIYAASTRLLTMATFVYAAMVHAVEPQASRLLTLGDHPRTTSLFRTSTSWAVMLTWPIYLTFAVHGATFLRVFGPEYVEGRVALVILAGAWLIGNALGPVDAFLVMGGKSTWNMYNAAVALGLNITLNLLLIPRLGMAGAALAWSASILANNVLPLFQVRRAFGLHPFSRAFVLVTGLATVSYLGVGVAARVLFGGSLGTTLAAIVTSTVVYGLGVLHFRRRLAVGALLGALRRPRRARGAAVAT